MLLTVSIFVSFSINQTIQNYFQHCTSWKMMKPHNSKIIKLGREKAYRLKAKGDACKAWECHGAHDGMPNPKQTIGWEPETPFWFKAIDGCDKALHSCLTQVLKLWAIGKLLKVLVDYKQNQSKIVLHQQHDLLIFISHNTCLKNSGEKMVWKSEINFDFQ